MGDHNKSSKNYQAADPKDVEDDKDDDDDDDDDEFIPGTPPPPSQVHTTNRNLLRFNINCCYNSNYFFTFY